MNECIFNGRIVNDVEVREVGGDKRVAKFRIAVDNGSYMKDGEKKKDTTFLDCDAWGQTVNLLETYFSKGKAIIVRGELRQDEWEKDGQKRTKHFLRVDRVHFPVGNPKEDNDQQPKAAKEKPKAKPKAAPEQTGEPEDDKIPF